MRLATAVARCRAAALRSPLSTAMPLSLRCFTTSSLVASRPTPPVRPTPAARPTPSVAPNGAGSVTAGAANAGSSTAHAKPRAIHSGTMARRPQRRLWVAGIAAAAGAGAVYIIYSNMKPEEPASANTQEFLTRLPGRVHATILDMQYSLSAYFAALLETKLSDPTPDDLMNSMGPGVNNLPPMLHVVVSMEDILLRPEWSGNYGNRVELRPGLKEWFEGMQQAGAMVTLWNSSGPGSTAIEIVNRLTSQFGTQLLITPMHLGREHTFPRKYSTERIATIEKATGALTGSTMAARAAAETAAKEGVTIWERIADWIRGREASRSVLVHEKHVQYLGRPKTSVLLVDTDPISLMTNPDNAFLVKPWKQVEAEAAAAAASGSFIPSQDTLSAILAVTKACREDASEAGELDVPRTLRRLRAEAERRGFGTDAQGLYATVQQMAFESKEAERKRREEGLGGAARSIMRVIPALSKPDVTLKAQAKPYVDPALESGFGDSLLAARTRAAVERLAAQQREMMGR